VFENEWVDCRVTGDYAVLLQDLVYRGGRETFVVPAKFGTDFASVPRWATVFVPRMGTHTLAAILHDWFCVGLAKGRCPVSPVDADGIFRRIMREEGTPFVRRWLAWAGVRWGALGNRHRRAGWWGTFPRLALVSAAAMLPPAAVVAALVVI
jgi:hypothetical protein